MPLLGQTFDPLDFLMFGGGVLLVAFAGRRLFERLDYNWSPKLKTFARRPAENFSNAHFGVETTTQVRVPVLDHQRGSIRSIVLNWGDINHLLWVRHQGGSRGRKCCSRAGFA